MTHKFKRLLESNSDDPYKEYFWDLIDNGIDYLIGHTNTKRVYIELAGDKSNFDSKVLDEIVERIERSEGKHFVFHAKPVQDLVPHSDRVIFCLFDLDDVEGGIGEFLYSSEPSHIIRKFNSLSDIDGVGNAFRIINRRHGQIATYDSGVFIASHSQFVIPVANYFGFEVGGRNLDREFTAAKMVECMLHVAKPYIKWLPYLSDVQFPYPS